MLYGYYGQCVRLPNGLIVAREAYINFNQPYFEQTMVVKGPDGTIFSRGNSGLFYFLPRQSIGGLVLAIGHMEG